MENIFGNELNQYNSLEFLTAKTPESLVEMIKQIPTQVKIISIVATNGRHTAYFTMGGKLKKIKKKKGK